MFANTLVDNTVWILRNAAKKSKAPIWKDLGRRISGPRSNRSEVNLGTLAQITKTNEIVMIPGKLLATGAIGHKLTVCAFAVSEQAARKVIQAGGKIISLEELVKKFPEGKGVRIIG